MMDNATLSKFFDQEEFSDVIVRVRKDDGKRRTIDYKCHKIILSSKSEHFAGLIKAAEARSVIITI